MNQIIVGCRIYPWVEHTASSETLRSYITLLPHSRLVSEAVVDMTPYCADTYRKAWICCEDIVLSSYMHSQGYEDGNDSQKSLTSFVTSIITL